MSGLAAAQARISQIQSLFPSPLALAPAPTPGRSVGTADTSTGPSGTAFSSALASALPASGVRSAPAPAASTTGGPTGEAVVAAGRKYLGVPYLWGGTDPAKGLDCSGFIQRTYRDLGIELPRVSRDQAKAGRPVASMAEARPGDLIAFGRPVDHIGIYVGDGKMIVAPRKGDVVKIQDVYRTPTAIRRILPDAMAGTAAPALATGSVPSVAPVAGRGEPAYAALFAAAGARHGVSPALLTAVARAESGFNPSARSSAGAQGLMQFMPATAKGLGIDPWKPEQAVEGAARLLKQHLQRFGSTELALAAYNAGPGAVTEHGGVPPYQETQNYVRKIMNELRTEAA